MCALELWLASASNASSESTHGHLCTVRSKWRSGTFSLAGTDNNQFSLAVHYLCVLQTGFSFFSFLNSYGTPPVSTKYVDGPQVCVVYVDEDNFVFYAVNSHLCQKKHVYHVS